MAHVAHVESNLKTGVQADLGPCTLLVGANAAGKSGAIAALELALTGRCREAGAAGVAVLEMASGPIAVVTARLSDGRLVAYRVAGTTAKAQRPEWTVASACADSTGDDATKYVLDAPLASILSHEVADLLARDAKRQREALVTLACGSVSAGTIRASVPEAFRAEWDTYWQRARRDAATDADALVACAAAIRADLRAARATAKATAAGDRPVAPTDTEAASMRARLEAAESAARTAQARATAAERLPSLRSRLVALQARASATSGFDVVLARRVADVIGAAHTLVRQLIGIGGKTCTACGSPAPASGWQARLDRIQERSELLHDQIASMPNAAELDEARRAVAECEDLIATAPAASAVADDLDALRASLTAATQAQAALVAWEAQRREQQQAAARTDVLKALSAAADRIVANTLDDAVGVFAARASRGMANGTQVAVQLFDGARQVCRVGMANGGDVRSWRALSGAERAGLIAALAGAWGSTARDGMRLCVIDDVWLGRAALASICAGLHAAVQAGDLDQAIVCVLDDYGLRMDGWACVQVGAA